MAVAIDGMESHCAVGNSFVSGLPEMRVLILTRLDKGSMVNELVKLESTYSMSKSGGATNFITNRGSSPAMEFEPHF